jgi:hypothetical protein
MTFFSFYARKGVKKMVFNIALGDGLTDILTPLKQSTLPFTTRQSPPAFGMAFTTTDRLRKLGNQHFIFILPLQPS